MLDGIGGDIGIVRTSLAPSRPETTTLAHMWVEMLQGALSEAQQAQLT